MRLRRRGFSPHIATLGGLVLAGLVMPSAPASTASTAPPPVEKRPVAVGYGGAVSTVDADATAAGLEVLRRGGNAVDAAVAAAAALGVTEPYSAGIGGGGFFVYYDAQARRVRTIDGRETAPLRMTETSFTEDGKPIAFSEAVTSGLSVGVPGTPMTWQRALNLWGTRSLAEVLRPAERIANRGFVVDETFRSQTAANEARFRAFTSTTELFFPDGQLPVVGSVMRNPDLARTYRLMGRYGVDYFYRGPIAHDIVRTVKKPPVAPGTTLNVRPGLMEYRDLVRYRAPLRAPTHVNYRDYSVFGMAPPSSGGSTVGEALNILDRAQLRKLPRDQALHYFLEASALAFADRNRWVGDPDYVDVPLKELLSQGFATERSCQIDPAKALPKPVPPGSPDGDYTWCPRLTGPAASNDRGTSTTHLTVADRWGGIVSYTLTIEATGGSGIVVPNRGFILNNELTDFNFTPLVAGVPDPNLPAPGKRPRSSMSPTIVFRDGQPVLALGSPGGATIITTVLQTLINRFDFGMSLPDAIAAPRASQRNRATTDAEPAFDRTGLTERGHVFTTVPEIGAVTGIEMLPDGRFLAAAEPTRRGGGSAMVLRPSD